MSESDVEHDLDELYDDDDNDNDNGFTVPDRLEAPVAKQYTTRELHELIHEGLIDLNPPYQRDVVWTDAKQMKLIDSMYRNFYVPPVVFAINKGSDGEETWCCVDGKQRLTSIQKFFDGQIPYKEPKSKKAWWFVRPESAKNRLEVPDRWKEDFASKMVTCVEYRGLGHGDERDIFQRVQMGMPLAAAEKLQAISSPWSDWISELSAKMVTSDTGIADKISVDIKRGRDFQTLAQLVYCCEGIPDPRFPSAANLEIWLHREDAPRANFKHAINQVLTTFWHLANVQGLNDGFIKMEKRVSPAEFIFIGVLLYVLRESTDKVRAKELYQMRKRVREVYPDVRVRNDIVTYLWNLIADVADNYAPDVYVERPVSGGAQKKKRVRPKEPRPVKEEPPVKRPRGPPRKN